MEPERHIEKVLRNFAKKRREQAGPPLELHPVDRRLLQDEVARQTSKPRERKFFLSWLTGVRPRLSYILCVVALIAVGTWFVLPLFSPAKSKSMRLAQRNRSRAEELANEPAKPAQPAPARTPAESDLALKKETVDQDGESENKRRRDASNSELARNDNQKQLPPATVAPTAPGSPVSGQKLASSVSNSDFFTEARLAQNEGAKNPVALTNTFALADQESSSLARTSRLQTPVVESETLAIGPAGRAGGGGGGFGGGAANRVRFQRIENQPVSTTAPIPVQTKSADTPVDALTAANSVSNATLLASFSVVQNGRELQVIDHDGSVYKGYVQFGESLALVEPAIPSKEKTETAPAAASRSFAQSQAANDKGTLGTSEKSGWSFRVSGTNLSLRQNIIFSGNLLVRTNENASGQLTVSGGAIEAQNGSVPQLLFRDSRINGTVLIENTGKLDILAAPVRGF